MIRCRYIPLVLSIACQSANGADSAATEPVRLEVLGLSVDLPSAASWKSEVRVADTNRTDFLSRTDANGLVGVLLDPEFGSEANCPFWALSMLIFKGGKLAMAPAVVPKGWNAEQVNSADNWASMACLDIPGGVITATFPGPALQLPDSHKQELLIALEAVRKAAAENPPVAPAAPVAVSP